MGVDGDGPVGGEGAEESYFWGFCGAGGVLVDVKNFCLLEVGGWGWVGTGRRTDGVVGGEFEL